MKKYDYLIVGSGLYGAVFAEQVTKHRKSCLVIEKRSHLGGNIYTKEIEGINVHIYGAHIFHTSNKEVWNYINTFAEFNRYTNAPIANYKGEIYNLPFNMNTFNKMWGVITPEEAKFKIAEQQKEICGNPSNLEEQAIRLVGKDIYKKLIKGYTEKQWGRTCEQLPAFIIKRLPVRYNYDNNYFNDCYQGIPIGGYTKIIEQMLSNCDIEYNIDFNTKAGFYKNQADRVIYTGMIDDYFQQQFGSLEYRSLEFQTEIKEIENFQGNAVVNYTDRETPYTRIIEHKHFEFGTQEKTVITKEYPKEWQKGIEAYYPINDEKNQRLYQQYKMLAQKEAETHFGGRLAEYKYYDMDKTIEAALQFAKKELNN